jgi:hypothetical protein
MSSREANEAIKACLGQVVADIRNQIGEARWDFDVATLRGVCFAFERNNESDVATLKCDCARKLWFKAGTHGTSLSKIPNVKGILKRTHVRRYICERWVTHCRAHDFFAHHHFEFEDASRGDPVLRAHRTRVPDSLAVACQPGELTRTFFREYILAAGDENVVLADGSRSGSLLSQLILRCYTSGTFYAKYWDGEEQFSGGPGGVFVLAQLVSMIVQGQLPGKAEFEAVLEYIDHECQQGQVDPVQFAARVGMSIGAVNEWIPDVFLEPKQIDRRQYLVAKVQLVQDKMRGCLSLFMSKHLPLTYPEAECPGGYFAVVREGNWSCAPRTAEVSEWDEYAMVKVRV